MNKKLGTWAAYLAAALLLGLVAGMGAAVALSGGEVLSKGPAPSLGAAVNGKEDRDYYYEAEAFMKEGQEREAVEALKRGYLFTGSENSKGQWLELWELARGDEPAQSPQLDEVGWIDAADSSPEAGILGTMDWYVMPFLLAEDVQPVYDSADGSLYGGEYVRVRQEDKWGLLNGSGQVVLEAQYGSISWCGLCERFHADGFLLDGGMEITQEAHPGHTGEERELCWDGNGGRVYEMVDNALREAEDLPGGLYPVRGVSVADDGSWDWEDQYGYCQGQELVIPLEYDRAEAFSEGLAAVEAGGAWGYIDQENNEVIPLDYEASAGDGVYPASGGYVVVKQDGLYGLMSIRGGEVFPPVFQQLRPVYENQAWVLVDGIWGIAMLH